MKYDCGETFEERRARREKWQRWFAWHPVRIGSHDCRWLEWVERKGTYHGYGNSWWEYRVPAVGVRANDI